MRTLFSLSLLTLLTFTSCQKEDSAPDDPAGTLTVAINYTVDATPIVLYQDLAADGPYVPCPNCIPPYSYPYIQIKVGTTAALNWIWNTAISTDNINWIDNTGAPNGEIVNMGSVKGLGSVTSIPTTGWSGTSALEKGHGYVIRYRATQYYSTTGSSLPYIYSRLYVVDWVISATNGGIIGAKIKYQNNFQ